MADGAAGGGGEGEGEGEEVKKCGVCFGSEKVV